MVASKGPERERERERERGGRFSGGCSSQWRGVQGRFGAEREKKIGGHFLNLGHFGTYLAKFTPVTGP